jgi:hypothetical protein
MVEEQKQDVSNGDDNVETKPEETKPEEENGTTTTTTTDKPAENGTEEKTNGKSVENGKNGDHAKDNDNDDDDDDESSEEELGELEKPVEILTEKRSRKSVEAFVVEKPKDPKEDKPKFDFSKGPGIKLGDIPYTNYMVSNADTEDLEIIHRAMYGGRGIKKSQEKFLKRNIKAFCGWPFDKNTKEYKSIYTNIIDKLTKSAMKWNLNLLGLEKSETLDEMMVTLTEFLTKPVMIEKEVPMVKTSSKKKSKTKKTGDGKKKKDDDDEVSDASSDSNSDDR